jgi:hypothetical protein
MSSDTERITEFERFVAGLIELVELQGKRIERLELGDNYTDAALAKLDAEEAKALALTAVGLAAHR